MGLLQIKENEKAGEEEKKARRTTIREWKDSQIICICLAAVQNNPQNLVLRSQIIQLRNRQKVAGREPSWYVSM